MLISSPLFAYLKKSSLFEKFHLCFRAHHSTKTASNKVTNDLLMSIDVGSSSILALIDVAFNTVDYTVLLNHLPG